MGDAILRIPRDARVRAYRTRDTYDGVVPATSKRQPYCHSSYIELSGLYPWTTLRDDVAHSSGSDVTLDITRDITLGGVYTLRKMPC